MPDRALHLHSVALWGRSRGLLDRSPGAMSDGLPTPRTTLRAEYVRVLLSCRACLRSRDANLQALVEAGRGDVPLVLCDGAAPNAAARVVAVVMWKDSAVVPW